MLLAIVLYFNLINKNKKRVVIGLLTHNDSKIILLNFLYEKADNLMSLAYPPTIKFTTTFKNDKMSHHIRVIFLGSVHNDQMQ